MAKDPAFLFYPNDWMGGTMTMTRHQKGCYMDLLIAQFNNGPLSLETIKAVLGTDQASWTVLSVKFKQDAEGRFFSERLATEIEKRQKFSKTQKERIQNYWDEKKKKEYHGIYHGITTELPIENGNRNKEEENEIPQKRFEEMIVPEILRIWKEHNPGYREIKEVDYPACLQIAYNVAHFKGWRMAWVVDLKEHECLKSWEKIAKFICTHPFWKSKTLDTISAQKNWQKIVNDMINQEPVKQNPQIRLA